MDKPKAYLKDGEVVYDHEFEIGEMTGTLTLPYMVSAEDFDHFWRQFISEEMKKRKKDEDPEVDIENVPISTMYKNRKHLVKGIKLTGVFENLITLKNVMDESIPQRLKLYITVTLQDLINETQSLPE